MRIRRSTAKTRRLPTTASQRASAATGTHRTSFNAIVCHFPKWIFAAFYDVEPGRSNQSCSTGLAREKCVAAIPERMIRPMANHEEAPITSPQISMPNRLEKITVL